MKVAVQGGGGIPAWSGAVFVLFMFWFEIPFAGRAADAPRGEVGRYEALVARQPFMPKAGAAAVSKSAVAGSYRFTGFVILGEKVRAGVENVSQNKSYLLSPGDTQDDLTLKEVDVKQKRVVLALGGETFRLELGEPSAAAPAVVPQPALAMPAPAAGSAAPNPAEPPRRRIIIPVRR